VPVLWREAGGDGVSDLIQNAGDALCLLVLYVAVLGIGGWIGSKVGWW
jgi:hypothetical protein